MWHAWCGDSTSPDHGQQKLFYYDGNSVQTIASGSRSRSNGSIRPIISNNNTIAWYGRVYDAYEDNYYEHMFYYDGQKTVDLTAESS